MKRLILVFFIITSLTVKSQNDVEKNLTGAQIGLFGLDIYNESKILTNTSLRAEASLYPAIWGGDFYSNTGFALYPTLSLQPKYYYNINKRVEKGKNTNNNSANYVSLQLKYTPDWFVISNHDNVKIYNQVYFIPTFGIRRNFSENFNYEFKVGFGYGTTVGYQNKITGGVMDLGFKIGYDF